MNIPFKNSSKIYVRVSLNKHHKGMKQHKLKQKVLSTKYILARGFLSLEFLLYKNNIY